jgi:hypothetical protein
MLMEGLRGNWEVGLECIALSDESKYLAVDGSTPTLGTLLPSHGGVVFSGKSSGQLARHSGAEDRSNQKEESVHGD